ncbi:hypothetical protein AC579_1865 [Pseudocercospora musae]|uniref:Pyridoxamine 5'-phosphate oxidase Alr4036 family FMN-binding domain-containing protein n=1 Tax=Pseudocercospora musae TaxID=113226 RepID=A0A139IBH3_9PEZI|nr:hypothetical protein AC579_1865 [Pseudocercospora musae]KXT12073.1 hypothetical protein AC579_1865 [Pseudocercospora musae]
MDHELNITLTLGPFHFKISHKNHITPSLHDGTRNHHHHHHTKLHRKTSSLQTAATIASHASYAASRVSSRLSQHLRTLSLQSSRAMATTSSTNMPIEAPWKKQFQEHLSKMESPEFVFSSLHPAEKGSPVPYVPRARYCIHRAFWAELPENKHNTAPMNARNYASDMPTFTTDVRMSKTFEIFNTSPGHADRDSLIQGSGGGGPCEAVYWVKESMVQWRFKGDAFVIAPDIEGEGEESSGVRTVKSELGKRMRILKEDGIEEWSWKRELTGHFGNISPGMRGTFQAPPPGQPVDKPFDDKKLKLGEKVEDLEHPVARENFRVVVIRPHEVESVDLSDPKKSRRQVYKFNANDGSWSHEECWP